VIVITEILCFVRCDSHMSLLTFIKVIVLVLVLQTQVLVLVLVLDTQVLVLILVLVPKSLLTTLLLHPISHHLKVCCLSQSVPHLPSCVVVTVSS